MAKIKDKYIREVEIMSAIRSTNIRRIYRVIARVAGLDLNKPSVRAKLSELIPPPTRLEDGRINEPFLPLIAQAVVGTFPNCKPGAEELIQTALKEAELARLVDDLGSVYNAVVKEHQAWKRLVNVKEKLRNVSTRQLALQNLVRELGADSVENIKIATRCLREALGFSGVRVYSVDLQRGTWLHRHEGGADGDSRFMSANVPEERSEKGYLNQLLRGEISNEVVRASKREGLFEWHQNGEWAYLYIPDRGRCEFVESSMLQKDEEGDPATNRRGHGQGKAREILYLVFGKTGDERIDVYLITNWAARKPLFMDKRKDTDLLQTFAASMARARENARHIQELRDTSIRDDLTGVFNDRYFRAKIEKEIERAKRFKHPLTILMMDLDHFKKINDTYGHEAGNEVLKTVAHKLSEKVRAVDVLARYGGEEFVVILPETNGGGESALQIAERLRQEVEGMLIKVRGENGTETAIRITISIGVATFPQDASTEGDLIYRADRALYHAKDLGRNRVVFYKSITD
jgi:diguanylate cyclase (GGDEF)-like protein